MNKCILIFLCLFYLGCQKTHLTPTNPNPPSEDSNKLTTDNVSNLTYFSVTFSGKIPASLEAAINEFGFVIDTVPMPTIARNSNEFLEVYLNNLSFFLKTGGKVIPFFFCCNFLKNLIHVEEK